MTSLIADLFSPTAATADGVPRLADEEIYPEELEYVRRAVPKRRAEFATARLLAREALATLGIAPAALVPNRDRAPVWPDGVVGSISHTRDYCAVVVGRRSEVQSVGLDVENLQELEPALDDSILTPREKAWLLQQSPSKHDELRLLHFSAKEAFYKCQYPLTGGYLDFLDVELDVFLASGRFTARVLRPNWPAAVAELEGKFAWKAGKVLAGVELAP